MKATDGEATKAKTAHKAMPTKLKAKKPRGGSTKKAGKKKTTSAKKKSSDVQKTATKTKRITDTDKRGRSSRGRSNSNQWPLGGGRTASLTTEDNDLQGTNGEIWQVYDQNSEKSESDASWNENYRRLQEFHSSHGHSGVPIGWSVEPKFADWVSRQRQLFREIRLGYRIASPREEGRWKRLQVLKFPLDYNTWHWHRRYNELVEALQGEKYDEANAQIPAPLKVWVDQQKFLMESDMHDKMNSERIRSLKILGVIKREAYVDNDFA